MFTHINLLRCSLVFLAFFALSSIFAQTKVSGVVADASNQETLIGVTVVLDDNSGAVTDFEGKYELNLRPGTHNITFKYTGYEDYTARLELGEEPITLDVAMKSSTSIIDVVVVTGSRFERKATEETVTIDVITPELIQRNNNTNLAEVITRVPGVEVVDGQANIRSGSGYAYGAGSRVSVLVDDQPLLSAELADVKWNFVPIENAQQVEIIKGAASVLYGSAALNGVIHVRTAMPTDEPYTSVSTYAGLYNAPRSEARKWWGPDSDGGRPYQFGTYFAHRQKLKENFDLVVGGNVHLMKSYLKGADENRFRLNFNTRYRPKNENLTMGLNGNVMYHQIGNYFLWLNGQENAYEHIDPDYTLDKYSTVTVDPWVTYFDRWKNKHTIKTRFYNITKLRKGNENSPGTIISAEYQFQREFDNGYRLSAGLLGQHFNVRSVLFETDSISGGFSRQKGVNTALYAQADKRYFDKLNLTAGIRWEHFKIGDEVIAALPVVRLGANYSVDDNRFLRASFGQGYRVPSLGERYIEANISAVNIFPNYDLRPEKGWSSELGYKRTFKTKNFEGYVDVATFWMEYHDMTEFYFDLYIPDGIPPTFDNIRKYLGFKAVNVSRARIAGSEISLNGSMQVGKLPFRSWIGYTYSYSADLSQDSTQKNIGVFLDRALSNFLKVNEEHVDGILKYRSLHTARFDIETDIHKFTVGMNATFNSYVHNIDAILDSKHELSGLIEGEVEGIADINKFRMEHNKGDLIMGLRLGYRHNDQHSIKLIANNIFNREYMLRAGKMNAPRFFDLRYNWTF